ncbi:MAG TPA: hypothetical protein PLK34_00110 [Candidatus Pacearchaeota archaeon]|nr:hypothetical protein [Candidatus Pacearchaeota archaeon]
MNIKRIFFYLGLILSLTGISISFNNLRLNGFAISETFNDFRSYLSPLILFISGILIAGAGNTLEERLSDEELAARELKSARKNVLVQKKKIDTIAHRFRKDLVNTKNLVLPPTTEYDSAMEEYSGRLKEFSRLAAQSGMPKEMLKRYYKIANDSISKVLNPQELQKNVLENEQAYSPSVEASIISERRALAEKYKKKGLLQEEVPSSEELKEISKKARTFPISKIPGDFKIIHSFPDRNSFHQLYHPDGSRLHSPEEILKLLTSTNPPEISASSINSEVKQKELTRYGGAILNKGRIYDAGVHGLESSLTARLGKSGRYRGLKTKNHPEIKYTLGEHLPIQERVLKAIKTDNEGFNEFIVRDYNIGGLYLDVDNLTNSRESKDYLADFVSQIAKESLKRKIPLYEMTRVATGSMSEEGIIPLKRALKRIKDPKKYAESFEETLKNKFKKSLRD